MKSESITVKEAIRRLTEYNEQDDLIAINWWVLGDFEEDYINPQKALDLAQEFLDRINPELQDYVITNYELEEAEANA